MSPGDAVRAAMARARALTAGMRASSRNTADLTLIRVREAERRRCLLCSGDIDIGWCTCDIRCTSARCMVDPPEEEATLP